MRISDWSSDVCSSDLHHDHPGYRRLSQGEWLAQREAAGRALLLRHQRRCQVDHWMAHAMSLDDRTRTWQLIMTGDDLRHVTLETQAEMARLLDFDPSISHLPLQLGADRVHVPRARPRPTYEAAHPP